MWLWALFGWAASLAGHAAEPSGGGTAWVIHVSPQGHDDWSGGLPLADATGADGPVRTIAAAQSRARDRLAAMRSARLPWASVRVVLAPGEYRLAEPLAFDERDSGAVAHAVSYEALQPGTVTLSGAVALGDGVVPGADGTARFALPDALAGARPGAGGQLFVNGRRAVLARQPNLGSWWFVRRPVALDGEADAQRGKQAFVPSGDAMAWFNGLSPADRQRAVVHVMQSWTSSQHRLSSLPAPAGAVRVSPAALWPFLAFGPDQRYFVENVAAAWDAPGEWLFDGSAVHYRALADEAGRPLAAEMPVLPRLLTIDGRIGWVEHLQFRGLTFAYTRVATPDDGFVDWQAANELGAAVEVSRARRIVFEGCTVAHTGGHGLWFKERVRDSTVADSTFSDLGAGGIRVGLTSQSPADDTATGRNVIHHNVVTGTGRLFPGAVAVWLGQTFDNRVSQNTVSDTTYSAISVGWKWGYGGATSGRNLIQRNLLVNIGQGMLSDLGGIYTLGESPGTVVSDNVIREVRGYAGYGAGAWGLYNDEGTSGVLLENNVVVGTDSGGYHLHYGCHNTLRNNLLAHGSGGAEISVSRSDECGAKNAAAGAGAAVDLSACGAGCATAKGTAVTVSEDPKGLQVSGVDARIAAAWRVVAANAGARGSTLAAPLVATARPVLAAQASSETLLDIATTPIGQAPLGFQYVPAQAIQVVARAGAPQGRCLQFADGPQHPNPWEPFAYAPLNHTAGVSTTEFTIQVDPTTQFTHEWRDDAVPYRVGPSLRITAAGVFVADRKVAPVAVGAWTTLRVQAPVGPAAGRWTLTVSEGIAPPTVVDRLPTRSPGWRDFKWVGLVSEAVVSSAPCVGSFVVANAPR